jgi:hypothetical protein
MRWALAAMLLAPVATSAQLCGSSPAATRVASDRFTVAFEPSHQPIPVGKHFSLEFTICPRKGGVSPESVRLDAHMPEHRHGMNYAANVVPVPGGGYRADGLLFHMPGRWEIMVDVRSQGKTDRIVRSMQIE